MRRLESEYNRLEETPDSRFYVARRFGHRDLKWECVLLIESFTSAYRDSLITIKLTFPTEYPFKPPSVHFETPILHPLVHHNILCEHLFKRMWWQRAEPDSAYPVTPATARWCLDTVYKIIESEGAIGSLCYEYDMEETRKQQYMLFDKVVQRCLQRATPNEWADEKLIQIKLDGVQLQLLSDAFRGRFPELQTITRRFLGIEEGGLEKKDIFLQTYVFDAVQPTEERAVFLTKDGVHVNAPKWSSIDLLTNVDTGEDIPVPYDSTIFKQVLSLCGPAEEATLRVYNPVEEVFDPVPMDDMVQIMAVMDAANFLGANRTVMRCCFTLNQLIKKRSRILILDSTGVGNFKTYVAP